MVPIPGSYASGSFCCPCGFFSLHSKLDGQGWRLLCLKMCFDASPFLCVKSECEFTGREKKADLEPSVEVLGIPGNERCPDPALAFEEQCINVVLTGEY